jgi:hypothetical protein
MTEYPREVLTRRSPTVTAYPVRTPIAVAAATVTVQPTAVGVETSGPSRSSSPRPVDRRDSDAIGEQSGLDHRCRRGQASRAPKRGRCGAKPGSRLPWGRRICHSRHLRLPIAARDSRSCPMALESCRSGPLASLRAAGVALGRPCGPGHGREEGHGKAMGQRWPGSRPYAARYRLVQPSPLPTTANRAPAGAGTMEPS